MLKIRLQRLGRRNHAAFRIVLTDARVKRQGECKENLGHYDPHGEDSNKFHVKLERVQHWVGLGAQLSDAVLKLFKHQGLKSKAAPTAK